jgi:REP element-mobilizing transposase RayT
LLEVEVVHGRRVVRDTGKDTALAAPQQVFCSANERGGFLTCLRSGGCFLFRSYAAELPFARESWQGVLGKICPKRGSEKLFGICNPELICQGFVTSPVVRVLTNHLTNHLATLKMFLGESRRKSEMRIGEVYFYTATILHWKNLLRPDKYKRLITDCLEFLCSKNKATVYGFVIMPNHIHLVWEIQELNGKEKPSASLLKFTAHGFLHDLEDTHPNVLSHFEVKEPNRKHRFWQRDPLAVRLYDGRICRQKLDYIHLNPLQEKWNLAQAPEDYFWSSAKFYETGVDEFGFLTHYLERF